MSKTYWFKMNKEFFNDLSIKKLRSLKNGDRLAVIYLEMLLYSTKTDGCINWNINELVENMALELNESYENVQKVINFLQEQDLILCSIDSSLLLGAITRCGSISANAEKQKEYRERLIKKYGHTCSITNSINQKRYGGNYFKVLERDNKQCVVCGTTEKLCIHHIDGYIEGNETHNRMERLITLCRCCHVRVHKGKIKINKATLDSIGYEVEE